MNGGESRRQAILTDLTEADGPLNATRLAEKYGVTRQIIVADIALLRAAGAPIRAEHRGYVLDRGHSGITRQLVCRHSKEGVTDEFYAIVDNGGRVLDVQVEHSIYGTISAQLSIASRFDADEFVRLAGDTGASQLADLTGGVHIHTVCAPSEDALARIENKLSELGILVSD